MAAIYPWRSRRHAPPSRQFGHGKVVQSPFPTVTAAFYHYAASCPDNVAVCDLSSSPRELTYGVLAKRAQGLARQLRHRGVSPGQRIPLVAKRSVEMVVGIWAILSCGAQYVPLDGGVVPDETIRRVLDQAQSDVVLCLSSTKNRITTLRLNHLLIVVDEDDSPDSNVDPEDEYMDLATPDGGCYVIYTSGLWHLALPDGPLRRNADFRFPRDNSTTQGGRCHT